MSNIRTFLAVIAVFFLSYSVTAALRYHGTHRVVPAVGDQQFEPQTGNAAYVPAVDELWFQPPDRNDLAIIGWATLIFLSIAGTIATLALVTFWLLLKLP